MAPTKDVLDELDVHVRLRQLAALKDNWYEGYGKAPGQPFLKQFGDYFNLYYDYRLPVPSIFPTVEGNIQLEWNFASAAITLEVKRNNFIGDCLLTYTDNDTIEEWTLHLQQQEDWKTLHGIIEKLA